MNDKGATPPRHVGEILVLAIRKAVRYLRFDRWPRIDDVIESYGLFRTLREQGVIPSRVRFQVAALSHQRDLHLQGKPHARLRDRGRRV